MMLDHAHCDELRFYVVAFTLSEFHQSEEQPLCMQAIFRKTFLIPVKRLMQINCLQSQTYT